MKKVKNTIPVVDICSLERINQTDSRIIAEPFAEYLQAHPNLHTPHRHSFYHMVLFTSGSGFHTIDFRKFEVRAGQIYFMAPGQVHSWNFGESVDGYVINFSAQLFDDFVVGAKYLDTYPFLQGIAEDSVINLNDDLFAETAAIVRKIVDDVHAHELQMHELVRAYLMQLFILINRRVSQAADAHKPHNLLLLHNFRKLVDMHYADIRLPKEYAAMLYITPNHLNALCKDLVGQPAGEIIRERILLETKRLLINAGLSISEIAAKLNFTDNSHFTRFFKKNTNTTPEEFRKGALGSH